jgi:hypothetical protein
MFLPEKRGLSPGNAKDPVSDDGAVYWTFLPWRGMLSDPADFSIRHARIWFQGRPEGVPSGPIAVPAFRVASRVQRDAGGWEWRGRRTDP